jgi:hypothetical protein
MPRALAALLLPLVIWMSRQEPPMPFLVDLPLTDWMADPAPTILPRIGRPELRAAPDPEARIIVRAHADEQFLPVRYVARVESPWLVLFNDTLTLEFTSGPRRMAAHDTLYKLSGPYVWYDGRLDTLAQEFTYPPDPRLSFRCTQRIRYWVQFRHRAGRDGWFKVGVSSAECRPRGATVGPA